MYDHPMVAMQDGSLHPALLELFASFSPMLFNVVFVKLGFFWDATTVAVR